MNAGGGRKMTAGQSTAASHSAPPGQSATASLDITVRRREATVHSMATDLAMVAALMLVALGGLAPVYGPSAVGGVAGAVGGFAGGGSVPGFSGIPGVWLMLAVPAVVSGCVIAGCGVLRRVGPAVQMALLAMAQTIVGPALACPWTLAWGVLPTPETLATGLHATVASFKAVAAIDPPVGLAGGAGMAVWTLGLWLAFLAGTLAAAGQFRAWAAAPIAVACAASALLGVADATHRPWQVVVGILLAAAMAWWLAHAKRSRSHGPVRTVALLAAGALAAGAVCGGVDAHRRVARDWYDPPLVLEESTSPLSGMRGLLRRHGDDVLLTVSGLPQGAPVRLAVMDAFDGNVWNLSASDAAGQGTSRFRRVGARLPDGAGATDVGGKPFSARFVVGTGLDGPWLPLAGMARSVIFEQSDDASGLYADAGTGTALLEDGLRPGLVYTVSGVMPEIPAEARVKEAAATRMDHAEPRQVPDAVREFAAMVAPAGSRSRDGPKADGGRLAQQLAQRLAEVGWFSHGGQGEHPSPPGHGHHRLKRMFSQTLVVGDSEQYASAMALMARELGLASRVVLGFRAPDRPPGTLRFTGGDVRAWTEVALDGLGWVAFDPTPDESKRPEDEQALAAADPEPVPHQPPPPLAEPLEDEVRRTGAGASGGERAEPAGASARTGAALWRLARTVAVVGAPLWLAVLAMAAILVAKALALARARRQGSPRERILAGWRCLVRLARHSGIAVPAHGTRTMQAAAIGQATAGAPAAQREAPESLAGAPGSPAGTPAQASAAAELAVLARRADEAAFAGRPVGPLQALRFWTDLDQARAMVLAAQRPLRRWRTRLSCRR